MAVPTGLVGPSSTIATTPEPRNAMRRPLRPNSPSPSRQRLSDELLSRLSPTSAVEALRAPTGPLKNCLDNASIFEQSFAMKTAIASKRIRDWLDELSDWPWPAGGGSAGFEMPPTKRRRLPDPFETPRKHHFTQNDDDASPQLSMDYFGSLPANDIEQYEKRIDQIQKDMEELDLEEIKSQVLHHHILPLSRPGTPFSDAGRSVASSISYTKMEDLTAVITAITVQALPNLSKLTRLLKIWSIRFTVLRKVPPLLMMITDAEIAVKSGWNAIKDKESAARNASEDEGAEGEKSLALSRKDFEVMESVLQQKVSKPGRDADFMLDSLEGMSDTLPNQWLDRLEAVEKDYVDWVATAKTRLREAEWSDMYQPRKLEISQPKIQIEVASPTREEHDNSDSRLSFSPPAPFDHSSIASEPGQARSLNSHVPSIDGQEDVGHDDENLRVVVDVSSKEVHQSTSQVVDLSRNALHQHDIDTGAVIKNPSLDYDSNDDERPVTAKQIRGEKSRDFGAVLSKVDRNIARIQPPETLRPAADIKAFSDFESEYSFLESVNEEDEEDEEDEEKSELPPPRSRSRRESQASLASLLEPGSDLGASAYGPSREQSVEPELPRRPDQDEPFSSDALSPPSSPPLRCKPRSTSVTFKDVADVEVTPPRSPLQQPEVFDADNSVDYSPSRMSVASEIGSNDPLHLQISEVLKNHPKFKLSSKAAVNLNPPDLQLPGRPKQKAPAPSSDPFRRSGSALSTKSSREDLFRRSGSALSTMSSRAGTPSYMLAPMKNARLRSNDTAEIRPYYLTRSTGEAPIKLLVRCIGNRVMVRVGGGWSDLEVYLKDYALHHGRRSKGEGKVEVKDVPASKVASSPPSRPGSALDSPMTPLAVRKSRKSLGEQGSARMRSKTPSAVRSERTDSPSPGETSSISLECERVNWEHDGSLLGLSGPKPRKANRLSEESKLWVEDVKSKVRAASGERMAAESLQNLRSESRLGDMGKVGGTSRMFRKI